MSLWFLSTKKPKSRTIYHSLIIMYICFLSIKLSPKRICLIGRNSPKLLPISLFFIINWEPNLHTNPSTITHSSATFSEVVYSRGEQKELKNQLNWKNWKKITEKIKPWKNPIKPIRIFKKLTGSVLKTWNRKNRIEPKPSQTGKKTESN